jgi:hypothetical protein
MNSDTFIAQQKEMSDSFIEKITEQMQKYEGELVEALIIGSDDNHAQIYGVDSRGMITCYNDVGFAAIGIGGWHARSRLMQLGYHNNLTLAPALAAIFDAKKAAQIAPGVGDNTDMYFVAKTGYFQLWDYVDKKLHELHADYRTNVDALMIAMVQQLQSFLDKPDNEPKANEQGPSRENATPNERPSPPAAETARKDESGASKAPAE